METLDAMDASMCSDGATMDDAAAVNHARRWLDDRMDIPTNVAGVLAMLSVALDATELTEGESREAAEAFYRHDDLGDAIKATAISALMGRGIAATPAEKASKTDPAVIAWSERRSVLAADKAYSETMATTAARRYETLLALLKVFGPRDMSFVETLQSEQRGAAQMTNAPEAFTQALAQRQRDIDANGGF